MNWHTIVTIYLKELRDSLRDRRTLVSMLVIPTVVMPLLMFGVGTIMTKVMKQAREEATSVIILNGTDSPSVVAALKADAKFHVVAPGGDYKQLISEKKVRVAVEIPDGFEASLKAIAQESLAARCVVIGEDLGTVPGGFRDTLARWGRSELGVPILSTQLIGDVERQDNLIGHWFLFGMRSREHAARGLQLLDLDADDQRLLENLTERYGKGRTLYRDLHGRCEEVQVDLADPRLFEQLNTTPADEETIADGGEEDRSALAA